MGQGRVQLTLETGICVAFFVSVAAHIVKFLIALLVSPCGGSLFQ